MRLLTEQGRMEVENMDKFQERFLFIMVSLTIIFSFILIGFGVFYFQSKEASESAVIVGVLLFAVSSAVITTFFKK